jgi:hypothetical protein
MNGNLEETLRDPLPSLALFEVALFSMIQVQQAKCDRKCVAILYKPEALARERRFPFAGASGL